MTTLSLSLFPARSSAHLPIPNYSAPRGQRSVTAASIPRGADGRRRTDQIKFHPRTRHRSNERRFTFTAARASFEGIMYSVSKWVKAKMPLIPRVLATEARSRNRGRSQMTSANFLGFWTPSPLVSILDQSIVLKSRNLPYYVRFWITPPSPSADFICESPHT